jgi:ubiquinone/menaquinone biosynthesis C-methylase UbiE
MRPYPRAMSPENPEVEHWSALKVWCFGLCNRSPKSNLAAVDRLKLGPEDRFIDLGCGLGAALEHAAATGAEVTGIDPSPAMVTRAIQRVSGVVVREGSAESIPFEDDRFTAALAVSTYHHWADAEAGLTEVQRVLAPGGRLLILERKLKKGSGHGIDVAGADELRARLIAEGYNPVAIDEVVVGRHQYLAVSGING